MGLRDRGFVLDYYLPLFAGTDAAKRDRFRTRFPFSLYAPYVTGGGTGTAGGIGGGDGGFGTPIDFSIHTPVITAPNSGAHLDLSVCGTITASAFASDNGQTHVASRWMVEAMNSTLVAGSAVSCTQYAYRGLGTPVEGEWFASKPDACADAYAKLQAFYGATNIDSLNCTYSGTQISIRYIPTGATFTYTQSTRTGMYCTSASSTIPTTPTGSYVYDSGPDALHLTSLSIPNLSLAPFGAYRVMVRYKGSNGGWSDWAVQQVFSLGACAVC